MFPAREEAKALLAEAADGTFTKSLTKHTQTRIAKKALREECLFHSFRFICSLVISVVRAAS